ncbi:MAG TPA: hypothetical protein VFQ22_11450, partial [Longimicrobiales bacterium]|nr:hypothetical protein [Longimicrobiales bacterium]
GDRYALVERADGTRGLVWFVAWEDASERDRFVERMGRVIGRFREPAAVEPAEAGGTALSVLRVRSWPDLEAKVRVAGAP